MNEGQKAIHEKGFSFAGRRGNFSLRAVEPRDVNAPAEEFGRIKLGVRSLDDAVIDLGSFRKANKNYGDKAYILQQIQNHKYDELRDISDYYFESSGIYRRLCEYLSQLYCYDWYVTPFVIKQNESTNNKVLAEFAKVLSYLDNSEVKRILGNIALDVVKHGCYYGYLVDLNDRFTIQQLPDKWCRSRFNQGTTPVVEFNMSYFDSQFPNTQYRMKVLGVFPKEIQKGYILYKEGKLPATQPGETAGWFMLTPGAAVKITLNNSEFPPLVATIPSIIDLDQAQDLDRKKTMQQLLKILIQQLPLDKNGDLIFDVDEATDIHNNAVGMLSRAVGVDVLTTFADVTVADMQDKNSTTTTDDLKKVERTLFNNSGISQNQFNTDGNLALQKSSLNDEALMRDLIYQFQKLLTVAIKKFNRPKNYTFAVNILNTTINNYVDMAKIYRENATNGYSKVLSQIALGISQSSFLADVYFENEVLALTESMVPLRMSSTMTGNTASTKDGEAGRPAKKEDEQSEKTIKNKEAMS